jgi:hypothetical protein
VIKANEHSSFEKRGIVRGEKIESRAINRVSQAFQGISTTPV